MGVNWIVAIWSFCEATFFFVVPDVWLTVIATDGLKKGFIASLYALVGALIGGTIWYSLALYYGEESAFIMMDRMPRVMLEHAQQAKYNLEVYGFSSMMKSPWLGLEYKLYAVSADSAGIPYWKFMLYSIPARMTRFIVLILLTDMVMRVLNFFKIEVNKLILVLSMWIIFYAYF